MVAPAFVATCVTRFPAPVAEKFAEAVTDNVTVPAPVKSLSGLYGDRTAVSEAVVPSCVLPDGPEKSTAPSNAAKL